MPVDGQQKLTAVFEGSAPSIHYSRKADASLKIEGLAFRAGLSLPYGVTESPPSSPQAPGPPLEKPATTAVPTKAVEQPKTAPEPPRTAPLTAPTKTKRWHPWASRAVTAVSLLIGVWGLWVTLHDRPVHALSYYVHPLRTVVVQAGQVSRLKTSFDGRVITSNISTAQVAIWNSGNQILRADSVQLPVVIKVGDGTRILEATIPKTTGKWTGFTLDTTEAEHGSVGVSWRSLDPNDAAVVQIVYEGDTSLLIAAAGKIEGQSRIYESNGLSRIDGLSRVIKEGAYIVVGLIFAVAFAFRGMAKEERGHTIGMVMHILLALLGAATAVAASIEICNTLGTVTAGDSGPPAQY